MPSPRPPPARPDGAGRGTGHSAAPIVIEGPIARALPPGLFPARVPAAGPVRVSLDSLMAAARSRGEVNSLTLPDAEGRAVIASLSRGAGDVFLDPYTGQVLGH